MELWVITRGVYDVTKIVGVVGSKAEADAAVASTRFLSALDLDIINSHGPFKQGEILSRDDAHRV